MQTAAALIKRFFNRKKAASPSYSMRAFARDIDVSPSFLCEALAGKKRLGLDRLDRVAKVLDMDLEAVIDLRRAYLPKQLRIAVEAKVGKKEVSRSTEYAQANRKDFHILRNWFYPIILDLTECKGFGGKVRDISKRLGLHPETAAVAVRELIGAGHLVEKDGKLSRTQETIRFASAIQRNELREFHTQMIDKARAEIRKTDEESWSKRVAIGVSTTADPATIELARKKLSDCLHEISDLLSEGGNDTEVYYLAAQLFPLTRS